MKQKEDNKNVLKNQLRAIENRILELETSMHYFSEANSEIVHELNSSTHIILSYTYILERYFDYFNLLIKMYQDLCSEEIDSKIKEIKEFEDGVDVESVRRLSADAVKAIEAAVKRVYKNSNELHHLSKQLGKVI